MLLRPLDKLSRQSTALPAARPTPLEGLGHALAFSRRFFFSMVKSRRDSYFKEPDGRNTFEKSLRTPTTSRPETTKRLLRQSRDWPPGNVHSGVSRDTGPQSLCRPSAHSSCRRTATADTWKTDFAHNSQGDPYSSQSILTETCSVPLTNKAVSRILLEKSDASALLHRGGGVFLGLLFSSAEPYDRGMREGAKWTAKKRQVIRKPQYSALSCGGFAHIFICPFRHHSCRWSGSGSSGRSLRSLLLASIRGLFRLAGRWFPAGSTQALS